LEAPGQDVLLDVERRDDRRARAGRGVRQSVDRAADHQGALEIWKARRHVLAEQDAVVREDSRERPVEADSNLAWVEPSRLAPDAVAPRLRVWQHPARLRLDVAEGLRVALQAVQVRQLVLLERPVEQ